MEIYCKFNKLNIVFLLNGVNALLGLATSILWAKLFGTGMQIEAFFAASTLQMVVFNLMQTGRLGEIVLPLYHSIKLTNGMKKASLAFSAISNWLSVLSIAIIVLLYFATPCMMAMIVSGFDENKKLLAINIFRLLLPVVVMQIVISQGQILALAERKYGQVEYAGLYGRITTFIVTIVFYTLYDIYSIIIGTWVGSLIQLFVINKIVKSTQYKYSFNFKSDDISLSYIIKNAISSILYIGFSQIYTMAISSSISFMQPGIYASFNYVQQIYGKISSMLLKPVNSISFTEISTSVVEKNNDVSKITNYAFYKTFMYCCVACSFIIGGQGYIFKALWKGDNFSSMAFEYVSIFSLWFMTFLILSSYEQISKRLSLSYRLGMHIYISTALIYFIGTLSLNFLIDKHNIIHILFTMLFINILICVSSPVIAFITKRHKVLFPIKLDILILVLSTIIGVTSGYFINLIIVPVHHFFVNSDLIKALICGGGAVVAAMVSAFLLGNNEATSVFVFFREQLRLIKK